MQRSLNWKFFGVVPFFSFVPGFLSVITEERTCQCDFFWHKLVFSILTAKRYSAVLFCFVTAQEFDPLVFRVTPIL